MIKISLDRFNCALKNLVNFFTGPRCRCYTTCTLLFHLEAFQSIARQCCGITGVVSRITQIENITKNVNFHFLLLVFHQLSQRKCCAASYMMILEYHEKYGRRCNFYRTQVSWSDLCVWLSLSKWVTERHCWNFTDVTLADEDTNWILTDNDKKTFQGNVAMWLNLVANFGTLEVMSCIKRPNFEPICNKSENTYLKEIQIRF